MSVIHEEDWNEAGVVHLSVFTEAGRLGSARLGRIAPYSPAPDSSLVGHRWMTAHSSMPAPAADARYDKLRRTTKLLKGHWLSPGLWTVCRPLP